MKINGDFNYTANVDFTAVELPKFTYDFKELLNDPLINLGLGVAFGGGGEAGLSVSGYKGPF